MLRTLLAANASPMTVDGSRTFIVGERVPVVVDPGPEDGAHLEAILRALAGRAPAAILLTHAHADHAGLARALAARTGAPIRMRPGSPFDHLVDRALADGERIATDAGDLHAVPTPGHAPEHACFLWTGAPPGHERRLFAGDMFVGGADTTLVAAPEGNLGDYLASLDRLEALTPTVVHPSHGPAIADGREAVRRYRAHREERIGQVVRALRQDGAADPAALVGRVYGPDLHPALAPAAEGSLRAILAHLAAVGSVVPAGGGRHRLAEPDPR